MNKRILFSALAFTVIIGLIIAALSENKGSTNIEESLRRVPLSQSDDLLKAIKSRNEGVNPESPTVEQSEVLAQVENAGPSSEPTEPLTQAQAEYVGSIQTLNQSALQHRSLVAELELASGAEELEYIRESFEFERIDHKWASHYEDQIRRSVLETPDLPELNLKTVECRTNRCLVEANLEKADSFMEFHESMFRNVLSENNGLKVGTFWSYYSVEGNLGTLVIGRNPRVMVLDGSEL